MVKKKPEVNKFNYIEQAKKIEENIDKIEKKIKG